MSRIATTPTDWGRQLMEASAGIGNEGAWPATASTAAQVLTAREILNRRKQR